MLNRFISHEYYKGFANDSDIETFGIKDTFIASAKLPDDIVFTFTKAVFDNINSLRKLQPAFQFLTKKGMLEGLPAPIHPGAIKYYKEVGLLK